MQRLKHEQQQPHLELREWQLGPLTHCRQLWTPKVETGTNCRYSVCVYACMHGMAWHGRAGQGREIGRYVCIYVCMYFFLKLNFGARAFLA